MADEKKRDRLSPPLMHIFRTAARGTGSPPEETGARSGPARVRSLQRMPITEQNLRREVSTDLVQLLNCVALESSLDLSEFPAVQRSILNYGLPDLVHRTLDELHGADIDNLLAETIRRYEPRLDPASVRVARDRAIDESELKIRYVVQGDLTCEPLNVPVEFVADVEVTTGKIVINRL